MLACTRIAVVGCLVFAFALGAIAWGSNAGGDGWESASESGVESADGLPNIVVVLVDDLGVMDISVPSLLDAQGRPVRHPLNDRYRTPHLERMAAQGVRFSQFYAMSVCSPSRIAWMTGQSSARHRTTNWIDPDGNNAGPHGPADWNWKGLDASDVTLARLLRDRGYRTIHIGKGHLGPRGSDGADPLRLGFDVNVGGASIGQPGSYFASKRYGADVGKGAYAVPGLDAYAEQGAFLTDALTQVAMHHVGEAVREGKPFYLNLWHYAVHAPFQRDPRMVDRPQLDGLSADAKAFASLVEGVDQSLGQLLDHLETLGVAEETLVLFLGDNGSDAPLGGPHEVACAAPLRGKKGSHYEGGMRVPMIASWAHANANHAMQLRLPIARGIVQPQRAAIYDWFPTLLELVGIEIPKGHAIDGRSLKTLLTGNPDPQHTQPFLMHYPHAPHRSNHFTVYRDGDWKLIYHYFPSPDSSGTPVQLFDLGRDPYEQVDLASSEEERERLDKLLEGMRMVLREQRALMPVDDAGDSLPLPILKDAGAKK
ncbi:MAG: sulfatase-like hydrolase/transferase [Pirellula sp.]